jgi:hypothetical protein
VKIHTPPMAPGEIGRTGRSAGSPPGRRPASVTLRPYAAGPGIDLAGGPPRWRPTGVERWLSR